MAGSGSQRVSSHAAGDHVLTRTAIQELRVEVPDQQVRTPVPELTGMPRSLQAGGSAGWND